MTEAHTDDVRSMVALLDAVEDLPQAVALRRRSYDLLHLRPGNTVVDVGAGTGRAVAELADRGVTAIGIDPDPTVLDVARDRHPAADLRAGAAEHLPLNDREAAGYRADKVFHELADPAAAMREAVRVLRPGGRIVLLGPDWDTIVVDSDDAASTRLIVRARADTLPQPRIARAYRNLLLDAGFGEVTLEVVTGVFTGPLLLGMLAGFAGAARAAGAVSAGQAEAWMDEQRRRATRDRLMLALPIFVAAGTAGPGRRR